MAEIQTHPGQLPRRADRRNGLPARTMMIVALLSLALLTGCHEGDFGDYYDGDGDSAYAIALAIANLVVILIDAFD